MKLLFALLLTITLPWNQMFRQDMSLDDLTVWAALDISGLDINYKEGARAGLWGLTPAVARNYGLRVDKWVDERYDVKRSSEAAAAYMKELLRQYSNDTTRALMILVNTPFRQVSDTRWVTPGSTPRNISREKLAQLIDAYNITDDERACRLAEADSLQAAYNRQLQAQATHQQTVQQQQARQQSSTQGRVHTVKSGETLSHIASKYGCTIRQIKEWNGLKSDIIQIGQKLKIKK